MTIIKVGNTPLPNPSSYNVTRSDLDSGNTMRNAAGILIRDRVRAGVYKIEAGWDCITKAELKAITDAVSPAKFSVTFYDPTSDSDTTAQMYAGDRSGGLARTINEDKPDETYWRLSLSLIQY